MNRRCSILLTAQAEEGLSTVEPCCCDGDSHCEDSGHRVRLPVPTRLSQDREWSIPTLSLNPVRQSWAWQLDPERGCTLIAVSREQEFWAASGPAWVLPGEGCRGWLQTLAFHLQDEGLIPQRQTCCLASLQPHSRSPMPH